MATKQQIKDKTKASKQKSALNISIKPTGKKQTKSEILKVIADETGLSSKAIKEVFIATANLLKSHLMKRGSGEFIMPELGMKIVRKIKAATKKRSGRNPTTGESIIIPAKPKREVIRIKPLKSLKEVIEWGVARL
jgi:nucleoid DNA-binding protein